MMINAYASHLSRVTTTNDEKKSLVERHVLDHGLHVVDRNTFIM